MKQGGVGWLTIVGLSDSLSSTIDDNHKIITTRPASPIHDLVDDGREIWSLVFFTLGIPGRYAVPGYRCGGLCAVGDVVRSCGEGRRCINIFSIEGEIGGFGIGFIRFEFDISVGDVSTLGNSYTEEAHPDFLIGLAWRSP